MVIINEGCRALQGSIWGDVLGERGRHKDGGKPADPIDKRRVSDVEILVSQISVFCVSAAVDRNSDDDKDLTMLAY